MENDGEILIKIKRVSTDGEFSGWEADLTGPDGSINCEVTGPHFWGVLDSCLEYLRFEDGVIDQEWLSANKNEEL
jgi:hypothetical protein